MSLPVDLAEHSSSIIINDNTPAHKLVASPTTQAQKLVHGFWFNT